MTNIKIAPATAKKAARKGIDYTTAVKGDEELIQATLPAIGKDKARVWTHENPNDVTTFLDAVIAALAFETDAFEGILETERVTVEQLPSGEYVAKLWVGKKPGGDLARDPDLIDLMQTLSEEEDLQQWVAEIRDEADEDEDAKEGGSVVPDTFKRRYAEAGHAGHCGDWLAVTLNALVQVTDGKKTATDIDRVTRIADLNGVTAERYGKLGIATNGWQGRYRMTVRNMLTKKVADAGKLIVDASWGEFPEDAVSGKLATLTPPAEWCEANKTKVKPKKAEPTKEEAALKRAQANVAKKAVKKAEKAA